MNISKKLDEILLKIIICAWGGSVLFMLVLAVVFVYRTTD